MEEKSLANIDSSKLNAWERCCTVFWNIFYSFLIINEFDITIKDLNIMTYNLLSNDLENFITSAEKTSNKKNNIINLIEKQQNFIINDKTYIIPQNFMGIKLEEGDTEIKITFYYLFNESVMTEDPTAEDPTTEDGPMYLFFSLF